MNQDQEYQAAIDNICSATRKFQTLVGEEQGYINDIDDQFAARVPPGIYCLRMAYKVWNDVISKRLHEGQNQASRAAVPVPSMMGMSLIPGLLKISPGPHLLTPEILADLFRGIDPEILEEAADLLRGSTEMPMDQE